MSERVLSQAKKKNYITILTVLASFAVVVLHCNFRWYGFGYERGWVTSNFIRALMIFAVPVFFMISGATLIDYRKRYSTKEFAIKRVKRTVIPFLVWSIIAGVFIMAESGKWLGPLDFVAAILSCKFIDFYWFFPALFAIYFAIPFISFIPEEKRRSAFGYAIVVGFVLNSLLPFIFKFLPISYSSEHFIFPVAGGYLIFPLIGYYISHYDIPLKYRKVIYALGLLGFLMMAVGTWVASFCSGEISYIFEGYRGVPCVLYSSALFLLFKNLKFGSWSIKIEKLTVKLAPLAYGVYLVQWFVLHFVAKIQWVDRGTFWYRTFGSIIVYLICLLVVWVIKKTPVLSKIV